MKNKKIVFIVSVVLLGLFFATTIFYQNSVSNNTEKLAENREGIPFIRKGSPSFGENKNNVIITEFLDPQCESCKKFHPIMKEVFSDYKEEVKLTIRYIDHHNYSKFAIKLLESARIQNKFNEALDIIFKYQDKWAEYRNEKPELLWEFLSESSIDMEKLKSDFKSIDIDDILFNDNKDATTLNVRGTPTIYVNGKRLRVLSHSTLLELVESEIYK